MLGQYNIINEEIKDEKKILQKKIDDFINGSEKTVLELQQYILSETKVFVDFIKTKLPPKGTSCDDVLALKQNYEKDHEILIDFLQKMEQLDLTKSNAEDAIEQQENESQNIKISTMDESSKYKVQSFIDESIISKQQQHKIMKKLRLELENKEVADITSKKIKFYFETLEKHVTKPHDENVKEYHSSTNNIDFKFENSYKLLKSQSNNEKELEKLNSDYQTERKTVFDKFQKNINYSLPNIDFVLDPNNELGVYRKVMLLNKDITSEERQKFLATINTLIEIKSKIERDHKIQNIIESSKDPIYNFIDNAEENKKKTIVKKTYLDSIEESQNGIFLNKSNGDPIMEEVINSLVYLEENLKVDNELVRIDKPINEWFENIKQINFAKAKIKDWKYYKNITARNQNISPFAEENFNPIFKERIDNLKLFKSRLSNRRVQQWIVNGIRKERFRDLLEITKTEKYCFSKTIDYVLEDSQSKSRLWKLSNRLKTGIKWFGETIGVSKFWKSSKFATILLAIPLLVISPITTLPFTAMKSAYHHIRQSLKPNIYLERDSNKILKLKQQLDEKCRKIKIRYAEKMAIPDSKKSFFNRGKADSQYLAECKQEIETAKAEFKVAVPKITLHYEKWVKKQETIYDENGRANKKIEAVETFFNELKDSQTPYDNYEKMNDVATLNQNISARIAEVDYENQDLPENIKTLINDSGVMNDENKTKLIDPIWRTQLS